MKWEFPPHDSGALGPDFGSSEPLGYLILVWSSVSVRTSVIDRWVQGWARTKASRLVGHACIIRRALHVRAVGEVRRGEARLGGGGGGGGRAAAGGEGAVVVTHGQLQVPR